MKRVLTAGLAACALAALAPSSAVAAPAAPKVPYYCLLVIGPPDGPVEPLVGATLCIANHYLP